jgi:pyrrolidone-carboxylate peptidase
VVDKAPTVARPARDRLSASQNAALTAEPGPLRAPGRLLDPEAGRVLRRSFAHDFSEVPVHGDPEHARSAAASGTSPVRLQRCGDHPCPSSGCSPDESVLRRSSPSASAPGRVPPSVLDALRSAGSPLPSTVRDGMEQRLGHDFSRVRVHTDAWAARSASDVQARAYTVGSHVVFAAGQYQPATDRGNHLLAHELTHVVQQGGGHWSPGTLRVGEPGDEDEAMAERVAGDASARPRPGVRGVLRRAWESAGSSACAQRPSDRWLEKVVVDQEKAQSVTLHWSDGTVSASICSTGKGHCCVDEKDPDATAASVAESRIKNSNATPIGSDFTITDNYESHNGWRFWNTFLGSRGIALHQHHTVTGTPLSHGCVRLPEETAQQIFCGARQRQTRVEVRGFARPDCAEPELRDEWRQDFRSAGAATDGEPPERARIIRQNREESRQELHSAYGRELSDEELSRGERGDLDIPHCGSRGVTPGVEERRAIPETGAGANVPSSASEFLASSRLERLVPVLADALDRSRTFGAARTAADRTGRQLWNAATAAARAGPSDDRPLYWARVQLTRTIRQAQPQFRLTEDQRTTLIDTFDRASRGMTTAQFHGPTGVKRIVISGFDPFGLDREDYGETRATNPSGAAALALDGRTLTNGAFRGTVESVVFPVTFAAFDASMVENFFRPFLGGPRHADMIMTISMGGSAEYKVEQYAGRTRGAGVPDNRYVTPSRPGAPPGMAAGPEFIKGMLPGSVRGALGRTAPTSAETTVVEIPAGKTSAITSTRGPTRGSTAVSGSGGAYLSNEIFYRVGLLQLVEGTHIPFGHLHVPMLSPTVSGYAATRDQIVHRVEQILTATLPDL